MDTPLPPPLPPEEREFGPPTAASGRIWPWIVLVLVLALALGVTALMRRCTRAVDDVMEVLGAYSTETRTRWEDMPVHDVPALLRRTRESPDALAREFVGEPIVVQGTIAAIERMDDDAARIRFESGDGNVECAVGAWSPRAVEALARLQVGDTVVLGGTVDWINRGTIAIRGGTLAESWVGKR
ncbi:MAG: hypothetical protein P1V36_12360 [Planctomycetota bacterium]|nr:hypothetical protein [Planctomycetota bacterium]